MTAAETRSDFRIAGYPLQLLREMDARPFDVGIGYLIQPSVDDAIGSDHEALFVNAYVPVIRRGGSMPWRLDIGAEARRVFEDGKTGYGGAVQIFGGLGGLIHSSNSCGSWRGDLAFGVYSEAARTMLDERTITSATLGLFLGAPGGSYFSIAHGKCE